jgi:hypothetical protein
MHLSPLPSGVRRTSSLHSGHARISKSSLLIAIAFLLIRWEIPRFCRGGSISSTNPGGHLVSCLRSSLHISAALDDASFVGPPLNIPDILSSARLASAADCSPICVTNFRDRTLGFLASKSLDRLKRIGVQYRYRNRESRWAFDPRYSIAIPMRQFYSIRFERLTT